jgi:predicted nucleotide-binding protein
MEKKKPYRNVRFSADVLQEALRIFAETVPKLRVHNTSRDVDTGDESWAFDTDEEFLSAYRKRPDRAYFRSIASSIDTDANFVINVLHDLSIVTVSNSNASLIERVFDVFEKHLEASRLPVPAEPAPERIEPTIFIGHGRSTLWRELKDHLADKHDYNVIAYEVGARAGHTIRDILEQLLSASSFALLVMTGEDETENGLRARQNVVHELGLFQGCLGFHRAIAVAEQGVELFSNIEGVQQIRFQTGNIAESYGDVLATLRREFGDAR